MSSLYNLLLIGLGGGLGSMLRFGVSRWIPAGYLPWGTMVANVAGSLVIGWIFSKLGPVSEENTHWQAFLAFGFCGGFTTFSSFSLQTFEQIRAGQLGWAIGHVLLSVVVCLVAVWGGWRLGRI